MVVEEEAPQSGPLPPRGRPPYVPQLQPHRRVRLGREMPPAARVVAPVPEPVPERRRLRQSAPLPPPVPPHAAVEG